MDKNLEMETLVREAHRRGAFTGAWLFAENGEIITKGAVGMADPENRVPLREDTLFNIGSISKTFTASAVMLLRKRGLLSLADCITDFFPEIPYQGITVRHLLTHTAGLPDYRDWIIRLAETEDLTPRNADIFRFLCEGGQPPLFAPGDRFAYSNTAYCLLALIVEKLTGMKFESFMEEEIFRPTGMTATRILHPADGPMPDNCAVGLVRGPESGGYILPDDSPEDHFVASMGGLSGSNFVYTNIFDLLAWDRALRGEKLLSLEEQQLMYSPIRLTDGTLGVDDEIPSDGYGFGWFVLDDPSPGASVFHIGIWPGAYAWYERLIAADRILILLRCREEADIRAYDAFFRGMRAVARGLAPGPVRALEELLPPVPRQSGWKAFCGTYEQQGGPFRISEVLMKGGNLYARAGFTRGDSFLFRLYPAGGSAFYIKEIYGSVVFASGRLTCCGRACRKLEPSGNTADKG